MSQRVARRREAAAETNSSLLRLPVILAAVAVAAVVAVALIALAAREPAAPAASAAGYDNMPVFGRVLGFEQAPVTIVQYTDFQCPYCAQAVATTIQPMKGRYILQGHVRLDVRPIAFLGPESLLAAQAAMCAEDQGAFWPYHDKLYASQAGENRGAFNIANLKRFAGELGLEQEPFDACLDGKTHEAKVLELTREANSRGIGGTPTFFVNDFMIEGAVPFSTLQPVIEQELRQ